MGWSVIIGTLMVLVVVGIKDVAGASPRCVEDDPCWSWSTMGNLMRGVVMVGGRVVVVDPCRFAYADHVGNIDWTRTRRLFGDGFARRHGCDPRWYG